MDRNIKKEFSLANLYDRVGSIWGKSSYPEAILDLHNRLLNLEEKANPKKKDAELTRSQKILLLQETGILDKMLEIGLSANGQAKMVALLLGTDESDLRKIIRQATQEKSLRTQTNLLPLRDALHKIGLKEQSSKIDAELDGLGAKN